MLRRFPLANKNHGNVPTVALLQYRIGIYIDLPEDGSEFSQERRDGRLGFVAEVASGTRVESNVTGPRSSKAGVFGMSIHHLGPKLHLPRSGRCWEERAHNNKQSLRSSQEEAERNGKSRSAHGRSVLPDEAGGNRQAARCGSESGDERRGVDGTYGE